MNSSPATATRFTFLIGLLSCVAVCLSVDSLCAFSTPAYSRRLLADATTPTSRSNIPDLAFFSSSTSPSSALSLLDTAVSNDDSSNKGKNRRSKRDSLRNQLRSITGFSLTALRKTMRAATGISLTAVYASTLAVTGAWIRQTMRLILAPLPAWFRYFVQPFLVMYYAPLFVLRNVTGPTRKQAKTTHEHFLEGWKEAVETADRTSSYWPMHLDSEGNFEKDMAELDTTETIAESVDIALEEEEERTH